MTLPLLITTAVLAAITAAMGGLLLALVYLSIQRAKSLLTPADANTPSAMQQLIAGVVSSTFHTQKQSEKGTASGEARLEASGEAQIIEGIVSAQFPEAAAGLSMIFGPKWSKEVTKNKHLIPLIAKYAPMMKGMMAGKDTANNNQPRLIDPTVW